MTRGVLEHFDEPNTLEEAVQLVDDTRRLRARAEEIHDQAFGAAIRVALRGGRRLSDVPNLIDLSYPQVLRYLGRDDVKLLPYDRDRAVDLFLRYLSEIERDDISWIRADQLYVQPTPAVERVAALAARDGRDFPYTVNLIGEGLLKLGVVRGSGNESSATRTNKGAKRRVWVIEAILLDDIDLAWDPDFTHPLARSFRLIDYKHDKINRRQHRASQSRQTDLSAATEFLRIVRVIGPDKFGEIRDSRILTHPDIAVQSVRDAAFASGRVFPYSAQEVAEGLDAMGALAVDGESRRSVGRRIGGKLVRVWDIDISFIQ